MFNPDVEGLLKRPRIEKPNETFELPPPVLVEAVEPGPFQPDPPPAPPAALPVTQALVEEAAKVQELLNAIVTTAPEITIPVPPDEQPLLGPTLSTRQYLDAVTAATPDASRIQHHFEWESLQTEDAGEHWPALLVPDLLQVKTNLLAHVHALEGRMLAALPKPTARVLASPSGSPLATLAEAQIRLSQEFRFRAVHAIFTLHADLSSDLLTHALSPVLEAEAERLRPALTKVRGLLVRMRALFQHAKLLLTFQFQQARQAGLALIKEAVLGELLNGLLALMAHMQTELAAPLLTFVEGELKSSLLSPAIGDGKSQAAISMMAGTLESLERRYQDLGADLLRGLQKESQLRLGSLQALGERSVVGRWTTHLDQIIQEIDRLLVVPNPGAPAARRLADALMKPLAPAAQQLTAALSQDPALAAIRAIPYPVRQQPFGGPVPINPVDPGLVGKPSVGSRGG